MRDVFDKSKALPFAWRLVRADETIDLDAPDEAPGRSPWEDDDPEIEFPRAEESVEVRAEARAACARLEVMVDHAWGLDGEAQRAAATDKIARQAGKIDLQLCAMEACEGVRMARLFVRHWDALSRAARKGAMDACFWVELGHAELGDLIVEMVESGNERIASAIGMSYDALETVDFDKAVLARRLAAILDSSASWTVRELAAEWISAGEVMRVRPTLRRALRLPHLSIRARAVHALEELTPPALESDDVLFLLTDHVERRINDDDGSLDTIDLAEYADALAAAVIRLKPEGGEWPLLEIANPEHHHGWREVLDRDWALGTLAAAYPESAMPAIDELAKSWRVHERRTAVDAALKLPWREAEPRLLALASDGAPAVAERARDGWLERTAKRCPLDETAGLMTDLLEGPPSDKMLSRLAALRGGSVEARAALVDVLLREAPDREALVLLLFSLADDALLRGGHGRRLPYDEGRWGRRLVGAFGAPAVAGLCKLCARYPHPEVFGWFYVLKDLLKDGTIKRAHAGPVADLARKFVMDHVAATAAIDVLDKTLSKEARRELFLELLLGDSPVWFWASSALERPKKDREIDRRLEAALAERMASDDRAKVGRLLGLMGKRGLRSARAAAKTIVEGVDPEQAADGIDDEEQDTLDHAARLLEEGGALSDAWIEAALARPGTLRCRIALHLERVRTKPWRAHVERLLASPALGGAVAVEAAATLLWATPPIAKTDPRLLEVLERAEPAPRAKLLHDLLLIGVPTRRLAPHVARLVATATDAEVEPLYDYLDRLSPKVLRRLVPAIRDEDVRGFVVSIVGPPDDAIDWEG